MPAATQVVRGGDARIQHLLCRDKNCFLGLPRGAWSPMETGVLVESEPILLAPHRKPLAPLASLLSTPVCPCTLHPGGTDARSVPCQVSWLRF